MIRLEQNPKLGYYLLGNHSTPIYNKLNALTLRHKTNQPLRWVFNDDAFSTVDWKTEPIISLDTFYRMRAQQLRDKYQYLVLNFSGGVDSTNVLYSFLKNGIHLDEILVRHPESGLRDFTMRETDESSSNQMGDYEFAIKPRLKWVSDNFPNVKITIHDYFKSIMEKPLDESWITRRTDFFHPGLMQRFSNLSLDSQIKLYDRGLSTGIIYGLDKPGVYCEDGHYHVSFLDTVANTSDLDVGEYTNISTEFFYWTPDLPEMMVKQAHVVKAWWQNNPQLGYLIDPKTPRTGDVRTNREYWVGSCIYPMVENQFRSGKSGDHFTADYDLWFYKSHLNTHAADVWRAGVNHIMQNFKHSLRLEKGTSKVLGLHVFPSKKYALD